MSSLKRYWTDPFLFSGKTQITGARIHQEKPSLDLASSLFYPEGGGQLGDRGQIQIGAEVRMVIDTQSDDQGTIFVVLDQSFSDEAANQTATVTVHEEWRRRQMAQHTGQHLLSRLLHDVYQASTVSARLGEKFFSIDLDIVTLSLAQITEVEERLNAFILEDRPVRAWFPTPEELLALDLRKQPSVTDEIRVIQAEGFDVTPCGGTHCARTGQIGLVHILSIEKYKNMTRLYACAGLDAVRQARLQENVLQQVQSTLHVTFECVESSLEALRIREQEAQSKLRVLTKRLAQQEAGSFILLADAPLCIVERVNEDVEYAREFAKHLATLRNVSVVFLAPLEDDILVVIDRPQQGALNIGVILKPLFESHGGKGGGGPFHAEGRILATQKEDFLKDVRAVFQPPSPVGLDNENKIK